MSIKCKCGLNSPSFGLLTDKKRLWCFKCRPPEAVDLKNRRCKCGKIASFGLQEDKIMLWCYTCKQPDSVNLRNPTSKILIKSTFKIDYTLFNHNPLNEPKYLDNIDIDSVVIDCIESDQLEYIGNVIYNSDHIHCINFEEFKRPSKRPNLDSIT